MIAQGNTMSEFELAELTFSLVGYGMTAMALYFTVTSSYLIIAYRVGKQLSRSQLIIVSSLFLVFAISLVFGTFSFFDAANNYGGSSRNSVEYWLAPSLAVAELIGFIALFKSMYDIRKSKIERVTTD